MSAITRWRRKVCRAHEECSEHGTCSYSRTLGYYQCTCKEPYVGNGVECSLQQGADGREYTAANATKVMLEMVKFVYKSTAELHNRKEPKMSTINAVTRPIATKMDTAWLPERQATFANVCQDTAEMECDSVRRLISATLWITLLAMSTPSVCMVKQNARTSANASEKHLDVLTVRCMLTVVRRIAVDGSAGATLVIMEMDTFAQP
ncbi:hypothetical protein ANCDUO_06942 [Ancylostoma duodenale]|uniref:EGF-like domain-containing protein n=1 Tax=Ancylostoma duodenale TaxID=51022 RepID=A0A0C2GNC0_9BILA|nr:hypothetical protein ANCDUO_06942 [Ancylostoma duodenale]